MINPLINGAVRKRRELESFLVLDVNDAETKRRLFEEARADLECLTVVGDVVVGASISTATQSGDALENRLHGVALDVRSALEPGQPLDEQALRIEDLRLLADYWLDQGRPPMAPDRQCLHWPLEFPEIFVRQDRPGFDAVVGNPPFQGGQKLTGSFGAEYGNISSRTLAMASEAAPDLVTYFFLRGAELVRQGGSVALLATNTIAQGDTREVGLDWLTAKGWSIPRAVKSRPWPGDATLEVAEVWLHSGPWDGAATLDDRSVSGITSGLEPASRVSGKAHRLVANRGKSFQGSNVLGLGFMLEPDEARALMRSGRSQR